MTSSKEQPNLSRDDLSLRRRVLTRRTGWRLEKRGGWGQQLKSE